MAKAGKVDLQEHDVPRLAWWGRVLAAAGVEHLQAITPERVDEAKARLLAEGRRPATVQRYLAVLRHFCQLAVRRWWVLERNPVLAVDWPQATPAPRRIPTLAEVHRVVAAAEPEESRPTSAS